jgi:integrase
VLPYLIATNTAFSDASRSQPLPAARSCTLNLERQKTSYGITPPKTDKSERTLVLPDVVFEALRAWHAVQKPVAEYVFTTSRGGLDPVAVSTIWRWCDEIGFNPHKARHYGATKALEEDPELLCAVSRYLGHADIKTTVNV